MKAKLKWIDGVCFMGETGSGHAVVMDGAPEGGGLRLAQRHGFVAVEGDVGAHDLARDVAVGLLHEGRHLELSHVGVAQVVERLVGVAEDLRGQVKIRVPP